jgi:hypothetical protein
VPHDPLELLHVPVLVHVVHGGHSVHGVIRSQYVTMVDNNRDRSCIATRPVYTFLEYLLFISLRL